MILRRHPGLASPACLAACLALAWQAALADTRPAAQADDANRPAARDAWRKLMLEGDPARRDALIPAAIQALGGSPDAARRLIETDDAFDAIRPGRAQHTVSFTDPADRKTYEVTFTVVAPPGYRLDSPWPVLLAAHGQHGDGAGFARTAGRMLGGEADKYIVVAPTMPGPREFSGKS